MQESAFGKITKFFFGQEVEWESIWKQIPNHTSHSVKLDFIPKIPSSVQEGRKFFSVCAVKGGGISYPWISSTFTNTSVLSSINDASLYVSACVCIPIVYILQIKTLFLFTSVSLLYYFSFCSQSINFKTETRKEIVTVFSGQPKNKK